MRKMIKMFKKWLLKEIAKENSAQWQAIWDLRGALIAVKENGLDVEIKEVDISNVTFFNSKEEKEVGVRRLAGYKSKDDCVVFDNIIKLTGRTPKEITKVWSNIEKHSIDRTPIKI